MLKAVTNEYWLNRWKRNETGWHQTEPEPALVHWFSGRKRARIFVPLCGKSLDLKWLLEQGHEVIGCELSENACETFLKENDIEFQVTRYPKFNAYLGPSITIYNGDIFDLSSTEIGKIDALYDRAALIALPPSTRQKYATHLSDRILTPEIHPSFEWLQIILSRTPCDSSGPPYSVGPDEIESLYGNSFQIELRGRWVVEFPAPPGTMTEELVFKLKVRRHDD